MNQVHQLRLSGFKVRVWHWRRHNDGVLRPLNPKNNPFWYEPLINAKGGKTEVHITSPRGENVKGVSLCSVEDNFDRKRGLAIALGRALIQWSPAYIETMKKYHENTNLPN